MDANDPCRSAYLPGSKSIMGLAPMERAKPIVNQTFDVVGAFATAAVSPSPHLIPCRARCATHCAAIRAARDPACVFILYCAEFCRVLCANYSNQITQLVFDIAGSRNGISNFLAQ